MKKILILTITLFTLLSCSSNDDAISNSDPIIGKWQLNSETKNDTEVSTECDRKNTLTFSENGTLTDVNHEDNGNGCSSNSLTSTWENSGNSNYKITPTNGDSLTIQLIFSQNNTVFKHTRSETINGLTKTEVSTFNKI
jgi:hypothetical protein